MEEEVDVRDREEWRKKPTGTDENREQHMLARGYRSKNETRDRGGGRTERDRKKSLFLVNIDIDRGADAIFINDFKLATN